MQETIESSVLVSVIMPVYNPGACFRDMLDALHNQSLQCMEIICILDCPTDNSDVILAEYTRIDPRFIVIRNEVNKGVGESRNIGLQMAKGVYVGFCDDDDSIISHTFFEDLYTAAQQHNADVVMSDVIIDNGGNKTPIRFDEHTTNFTQLQSLLFPEYSSLCKNKLARSVWHSVYKRDFIEKNIIGFYSRSTHLEEDTLFNVQVFTKTNNFLIVPNTYYCWNLTNTRNMANFQSQNDIRALKAYFDVVHDTISSSELLNTRQKKFLLKGCLSAHFFQRYCIWRDIEMNIVLKILGSSIRYLSSRNLMQVYFESPLGAWRNIAMLTKFTLYVWRLKYRYYMSRVK